MPEYDAFGREIGENTLAGLGGESPRPESASPEEPAARVVQPPPEAAPSHVTLEVPEGAPVTVIPGRRRRTSGLGCFVGFAILAAILAVPVIGIVGFVGSATDVIEDVTDAFDPDTLELPGQLLPPPVGITERSMLAPPNLAAALDQVRDAGHTRAGGIDVRPDRVTFTVVKNGRRRDLVVGYDKDLVRGAPSPENGAAGTIGLAALDPAAPARLVRGAAKRYRVRPRGIGYVLAGPERGGGHHWRAYFKSGVYVEGDAAGRVIRRFDGG